MNKLATAIQQFVDGYTKGDVERVVDTLLPSGVVVYNGYRTVGRDAIRQSLAMVGKFAFTVDQAIGEGTLQTVEGEMIPVVEGVRKAEHAVPYAGVAEMVGGGETIKEFRLYYDGNRLDRALDACGFRP